MFSGSPGPLIARLGGANPDVLAHVKSAQGKFFQMGLVLLSTAGLAVLSMSFALVDALHASLAVAIPLGLTWGFIILNLDRALILHMRPATGVWRTLAMVLPRLAIAGLISIVVATPLVLRIFNSEINAEMAKDNAVLVNQIGGIQADSPVAKRLAQDNQRIATDEATLRGQVPGATSPNVAAAQAALATDQATLTSKQAAADQAYAQMVCELDGQRCSGASGNEGAGPRYQALKLAYDTAAAEAKTAEQAVATDQQALQSAQQAAAQNNTTALAAAQAQANRELPGLRNERDALQAQQTSQAKQDEGDTTDGILARIQALSNLGDGSTAAFLTHWSVAGLLFMIELLPVLVKLLTALGPPTVYDRVSDLLDDSTYDAASQQRNIDRRRIEQDSKKRRQIEDDMRDREVQLGIKANAHVAGKMEEILDLALEQWSDQVGRTLHEADAASQTDVTGSAPPQPVRDRGQVSDTAVRLKYGLPGGGQL